MCIRDRLRPPRAVQSRVQASPSSLQPRIVITGDQPSRPSPRMGNRRSRSRGSDEGCPGPTQSRERTHHCRHLHARESADAVGCCRKGSGAHTANVAFENSVDQPALSRASLASFAKLQAIGLHRYTLLKLQRSRKVGASQNVAKSEEAGNSSGRFAVSTHTKVQRALGLSLIHI